MNALKSQEYAPMPTPAMRQMDTPESTMGPLSVEDILAERRGPTPWDEPQDGMEVMPPDDFMLERPLGQSGANPYVANQPRDVALTMGSRVPQQQNSSNPYTNIDDGGNPNFWDDPAAGQMDQEPTPQPGTPEFYEWLMSRVG